MTSPRILLKAWNLRPKKRLGQNFLVDSSTADRITNRADLSKKDLVLEIGAGIGALTIPLARLVKKLYAVEKDRQLVDLLKTELLVNQISNCEIIAEDFLKIDLHSIAERDKQKITIVGNLPYGISSQILIKLIKSRSVLERAVLMFQKELAQRLAAQPGSKEYGRITAMLRYCADIRFLANVKSSAFYPSPNVDSAVVEIEFVPTTVYGVHDEALVSKVIKAAFGNRRKTLKNSLAAGGLHIDAQKIAAALKAAGIDPSRRAETLDPSDFVALTNHLKQVMTNNEG